MLPAESINILEFDADVTDVVLEHLCIESSWLEFWRRFNNEYNNINKTEEVVDDVLIYFDNKIGVVEPISPDDSNKNGSKSKKGRTAGTGSENGEFKFDIRAVIEKRNLEEDEIEKLIKEFSEKIQGLYAFIADPENGKRLIAKMKSPGNSFSEEEIYEDFGVLFRKYVRRNRKILGDFFINEASSSVHKLCDDFEKYIHRKEVH